jgi:hypothetical protein
MEIRIYVEGGGDHQVGKAALRRGIGSFLNPLCIQARKKRIGFQVIACGSRNSTFDDFKNALKVHSDAINILLVDSEGPIRDENPCDYLRQHEPSWQISKSTYYNCHLMAQTMEAWVIADLIALSKFYGQGFNRNYFPANQDVEAIPKERLERALYEATRRTSKGEYHKIRHGPEILANADQTIVCSRARHCEDLFNVISAIIVFDGK